MQGFWDFFWVMIWFYLAACYFGLLFLTLGSVLVNPTLNGWLKALWVVALLFVPIISMLIYFLVNGGLGWKGDAPYWGMYSDRQPMPPETYADVSPNLGSKAGSELSKAQSLLNSGAITSDEFNRMKSRLSPGSAI